jgi:hypothetical protein
MKDPGTMHYFLGLEVWERPDGIFLNQGKYAVEILNRFWMMDCKATPTPMVTNMKFLCDSSSEIVDATMYRQLVGSLMYLTNTRLDIRFTVNRLSQYMAYPRHVQLVVEKHVLRYLKGIVDYGLRYDANCEIILHGYTYSDGVSSVVDQKSTFGCCFSLGSSMISWFNKKYSILALSTAEEEYILTLSTGSEAVWFCKFLDGVFDLELEVTFIWCDN